MQPGVAPTPLRRRGGHLGRDVEGDRVAGPDQGQRPADMRLGRDVQHARAVTRAAHPGVGDPHHVPHALLQQVVGIGSMPYSGMPGPPLGPALRSTSTLSAVMPSAGSLMVRCIGP